jgi:geranylgeranyl transferase type-2 subunit alpha
MHGVLRRVKTDDERERERQQRERERCDKYIAATASLRKIRTSVRRNEPSDTTQLLESVRSGLQVSQRVLELNTENYSAWNLRRDLLLRVETARGSAEDPDPLTEEWGNFLANELGFLERMIGVNPKSYWSWLHRRWCTERANVASAVGWQRELKLCDKLLSLDERNFHCWGYRRFAAAQLLQVLPAEETTRAEKAEFAFTTKKIEDNFSNYSAWHQRSALLAQTNTEAHLSQEILDREFELVQNAFYTEPNDSAAWFYHHWLVGQLSGDEASITAVLDRELGVCKELLELEPDSKWPLLTVVRLLRRRMELSGSEERAAQQVEALKLLESLRKVDPKRQQMYTALTDQIRGMV